MNKKIKLSIEISEQDARTLLFAEALEYDLPSVDALLSRRKLSFRELLHDTIQGAVDYRVEKACAAVNAKL